VRSPGHTPLLSVLTTAAGAVPPFLSPSAAAISPTLFTLSVPPPIALPKLVGVLRTALLLAIPAVAVVAAVVIAVGLTQPMLLLFGTEVAWRGLSCSPEGVWL